MKSPEKFFKEFFNSFDTLESIRDCNHLTLKMMKEYARLYHKEMRELTNKTLRKQK